MYFSKKGLYGVQVGFSRIFALKVTLQSVRLLLTVSYRKKLGEQDVFTYSPTSGAAATAPPRNEMEMLPQYLILLG